MTFPAVMTPPHTHVELVDTAMHADLWADLTIHARHLLDMDDITIGTHPVLGTCIVSHVGLNGLISWVTTTPIPDALTD